MTSTLEGANQGETGTHFLGVGSSLTGRYWVESPSDAGLLRTLSQQMTGQDLTARLLAQRGVQPESVAGFLAPTLRETFPDPSSFADMDKAAELVLDAILANKRVTVFADYDVDGGTSSAILSKYFSAWDRALDLYVPDRLKEGYGPSPAAFEYIKDQGADLVITVDCGAAAISALEKAAEIDLSVIVIDHHLMGAEIPPCAALVNPNRQDDTSGQGHLAAAGVVFVFVAALNRLAKQRGLTPPSGELPDLRAWLDLAALGTLCDMAPLRGVNRAFARQGLKIMGYDQNVGIRALADISGIGKIDSVYHATFQLGPRLNAGGRVGDPWLAAKLLACDDREEAIGLAEHLHQLNEERKLVEAEIQSLATAQAENALAKNPDLGILIAHGEGWHPGVIGIVAGRLKDRFHLPTIVIGYGAQLGPVAKGSGRSVNGVNIGDAIAAAAKAGVIISGGGHAMAGGLSLEPDQIDTFREWMQTHMEPFTQERVEARALTINALLSPGAATVEQLEQIEATGPFGAGAPQPIFVLPDVEIGFARRIGVNHVKVTAEDASGKIDCLAWRVADEPLGEALLARGRFHLAGRLKVDTWQGRNRVQMELVDAVAL